MLSDLPLSIIHIILSFLPIRDAIRTSFLSTKWRNTWVGLPNLVFNPQFLEFLDVDKSELDHENCIKNLITRALSLHEGSIICSGHGWPQTDEWLHYLSRNNIRELALNFYHLGGCTPDLHSSVYHCKKLTYLELRNCDVGPPPSSFEGFSFLRCLILLNVRISHNDAVSLIANCPLLERLKLRYCGNKGEPNPELRINAPNLKYLYLVGEWPWAYIEISLNAPLLAEMFVCMEVYPDCMVKCLEYQQKKSSFCNYISLIGGCTNLEKLRGDYEFTSIMSIGIESCLQSFIFYRLKYIELNHVDFRDVKAISVLARLVMGAPNLQKLKFSNDYISDSEEEALPHVSYLDFGCAADFKWEKLRVMVMSKFTGLSSEMEFLEFLLEHSPGLQRMDLCSKHLAFKELKRLRAELLGCNLASPNFKLWFDPWHSQRTPPSEFDLKF